MGIFILLLYLGVMALLARWLFGRNWRPSRRNAALLALVLAVPLAVTASFIADGREAAGWGLGLLMVTLVPANLLAVVAGHLWHERRKLRP